MYNFRIPCSHFIKMSQIIPEQSLGDVSVYTDAIPYIKCMIKSTIQHESAHRTDESNRNDEILRHKQNPGYPSTSIPILPFNQFTSENRAEQIAEGKEENCEPLLKSTLSRDVMQINLSQIFEESKSAANIDSSYLQDIKAGHLPPEAQGMYVMQDMMGLPLDELIKIKENNGNTYIDLQNNLWIDVRKIVQPFIANENSTNPSTYQGPGDGAVEVDTPGISQDDPQNVRQVSDSQSVPSAPSVPGRSSI